MKRLCCIAVAVFVTLAVCGTPKAARAQQQPPIFAVWPADCDWLRYVNYDVEYDYARVLYVFGEVKVIRGDNTSRVVISHAIREDTVINGTESRGDHQELASFSRTENFVIPSHGSVSFYRFLKTKCVRFDKTILDINVAIRSAWDITDTTQFVVYLVRASDNAILSTLDSVGTFAKTPKDTGDMRFGTRPRSAIINCALPERDAGTMAYLEIMPAWYGAPTSRCFASPTKGISLDIHGGGISYSSLYNSSGNKVLPSDNTMAEWNAIKDSAIYAYTDSVYTATGGCFPAFRGIGFDSDAQYDRYFAHFHCVRDTFFNGTFGDWINPKCHGKKPVENSVVNLAINDNFSITQIKVDEDNKSLQLVIHATYAVPYAKVEVFSASGTSYGTVWKGDLSGNETLCNNPLPAMPSGTYFIKIYDGMGYVVAASKFIIVK